MGGLAGPPAPRTAIDEDMEELTKADRELLRRHTLACARATVLGESLPAAPDVPGDALQCELGVFVTVTVAGDLRGCIGRIEGDGPLISSVGRRAADAVRNDPRFPPIRSDELEELEVEVSVLSRLRPVDDVSQVEPGRHGVLVSLGDNAGLLLPQVAERYGWDAETFVAQACRKARIPDERQGEARIEVFEAQYF